MLTQIVPVDQSTVITLNGYLLSLTISAQDVSARNTFEQLRKAKESLDIAKGLHMALSALELTDGLTVTDEDLERIERKQLSILEDKRRRDYPWRKHY